MNKIFLFQHSFIKSCALYLKKTKKRKIDISISPLCFLTIWASTPGRLKIDEIIKKKNFFKFFYIFKNILSISKNSDLTLFYNNSIELKKLKHKNIVISYISKNNFDKFGNFRDFFFNTHANKNKNLIWFLISLDNYLPKKIENNIIIVAKKNFKSLDFIYILKSFGKLLISHRFSLKKIYHYFWFDFNYAIKISELFEKFFKKIKFKNVLLNYEGTIFQNYLLKTVKKINNKSKTLGYLHCAPWPVQTDLFHRNNLLDKLIVSGVDQKKVLEKNFEWRKGKISVVPSLRFDKKRNKEFCGFIFIPFKLNNYYRYLSKFDNFLQFSQNAEINNLTIRIHPLNKLSKIHNDFAIELKKIMKKNKNKFVNKNKNLSFFFGSATGVSVQALEEGTQIIHFPDDALLDTFSSDIWKNIEVIKLNENVFKYKIRNRGKIFYTNYEKNKFKKYILPLLN